MTRVGSQRHSTKKKDREYYKEWVAKYYGNCMFTYGFTPKDEIWFLRVCHHFSNAVYSSFLIMRKPF